ncbi:opacity protein-like surface antigen [Rhodobacter sp. JA431]|uniref:outer membrane protein n=1 Tax=Rhodobacter sp. JA431 TaxID=570013 RepID=UPI000BCAD03E|nr:outer membrane beta-barrel protein [Rhodobacter sp. JA431]SOB91879.1 opacity protein-like surface antigen [Rhodobacter sp. JA431]
MKKVMAVLAALVVGTQVQAQEAAQVSWQGAYLGAEISHDRAAFDRVFHTGEVTSEWDVSGTSLGMIGGYNWQRGAFVYGVEVGLFTRDMRGNDNGIALALDATDMNQAAELGLRMGYAKARNLYYVTVGRQWSKGAWQVNTTQVAHTFKASYLGLGVEHAFDQHLRLRGELRSTDYDTFSFVPPGAPIAWEYAADPRPEIRLGLTYQF